MSRAYTGTLVSAMATIRFGRLGPRAAAMPSARTKFGKAWSTSIARISPSSPKPPANPATAPRAPPRTSASPTAPAAMRRSRRAPHSTRERMSSPKTPVPKGCAADGGRSAWPGSVAYGSAGAMQGASSAIRTRPSVTARPAVVVASVRINSGPPSHPPSPPPPPTGGRGGPERSNRSPARSTRPGPRVQHRVEEVHDQEDRDVHRGGVEDEPLDGGVVGVGHGVVGVLAEPRPGEDGLDEDHAAELVAGDDGDHGDDRQERGAEGVADDDGPLRQAEGPGRP